MKRSKDQRPKPAPEEYLQILEGMELESIALRECAARIITREPQAPLEVTLRDDVSHKVLKDDRVEVLHKFDLSARPKGKKRAVIKISCSFALTYSCATRVTEEFMEIFDKGNVPLNSWPYFREFVQNMTSRMNIPPLTLPLLK